MSKFLFVFIITCLISLQAYSQSDFQSKLAEKALELSKQSVTYDPSYFRISYPNGDVPVNKGVCTDVIIRAYRLVGVDLQKEVHEDMAAHFNLYPKMWRLKSTDTNIDHRRVPNLMTFFSRKGVVIPITNSSSDYLPGDIVAWDLGNGLLHIGLVVNRHLGNSSRYMLIHNIGNGQVLEDCLFGWKIIGHYRYFH